MGRSALRRRGLQRRVSIININESMGYHRAGSAHACWGLGGPGSFVCRERDGKDSLESAPRTVSKNKERLQCLLGDFCALGDLSGAVLEISDGCIPSTAQPPVTSRHPVLVARLALGAGIAPM